MKLNTIIFKLSSLIPLLTFVFVSYSTSVQAAVSCARTVTADVVAIDQSLMFNRLGAQNINFMVYALRNDVINTETNLPLTHGGAAIAGQVALRPDKRPRPLILRVAAGDCLQINFQNLLTSSSNPFNAENPLLHIDNQVKGRYASFHPFGMQLANSIDDDGSFVGKNSNSLTAPGESRVYTYYAEKEGAFMAYSQGAVFGGEATGGNVGVGLFGVVNVEPAQALIYRSQLTEEERRLATTGTTNLGQPIINYEARYPSDCAGGADAPLTGYDGVWCQEGKAGLPIINMLDGNKLVHSDINAIIAGPNADGSFPASTYPLESKGLRNPTVPNRLEAFREFTVVFHDETAAAQAFPKWFSDPVLGHTLHGVRDSFMINYGSGGIGSEIIANRLGVGPMHDCLGCAYEEFFLAASVVGDPAQLVDIPANAGLEACTPALNNCSAVGPKATQVLYPSDPSNVHHSYIGDFVKFRNLHAGPKEQHVFHLHNHQWLFNPNDDNSNYIDAQSVGPGSAYTYEINFGGSGNRNKSAGDAIFHCHFYPHFAQGMWEMWRSHDTNETGTVLEVSGGSYDAPNYHDSAFALQSGLPMAGSRALPDGEILAGTPIPAILPLPGKAIAPQPGRVTIKTKDADGDGIPESSQAHVIDRDINPGFPFWIAGLETTVGQRAPTPPLDMLTEAEAEALKATGDPLWTNMLAISAGGFDGGLPRHTLDGYKAGGVSVDTQNRLDFSKHIVLAKPQYFPEKGTDLEIVAMKFHAKREHPSFSINMDGTVVAANFIANGTPPVPSAPFAEPCIDDTGKRFLQGETGYFFDGTGGTTVTGIAQYGADNPRIYKAANIQIDAVFNKAGYHFPQQRIITLWQDVEPTFNNTRPPEPFVIRLNTFDCAKYLHTNLIPEYYEMDDYQIRTPTDIIGQHIHLPKWDLVAADGSSNGYNYEDGTFSPGAVRERIKAINDYNALASSPVFTLDGREVDGKLTALPHPFFGKFSNPEWLGARTTIQRWFADPVVNVKGEDRGLGIIFTHDHYGPSTHQQVGLYGTVLIEPAKSIWLENETGKPMYTRDDGGPTSWQAQILSDTTGDDGIADTGFREFYFAHSDFQHAYEKGVYVGVNSSGEPISPNGVPLNSSGKPVAPSVEGPDGTQIAGSDTFRYAINPSYRQSSSEVYPDILRFPSDCPGGVPRPCSEAISADDIGMLVVNYRNEPIGLRVYDPNKIGPDGKPGSQADGLAGDLAFATQTRIDRAIPAFNTVLGETPYPALTGGIQPGDAFTPLIRAYPADIIKVKIQAGASEHEHNATLHGLKWLQGGSGHGSSPNSGWRNSQTSALSEQFTFSMPVGSDIKAKGDTADYLYAIDASQDGYWSGVWGVIRSYTSLQTDLQALPNNQNPKPGKVVNRDEFNGVCPINAPVREYHIVAVLANDVLGNSINATLVPSDASATMHVGGSINSSGGTLIYNPRSTKIRELTVVLPSGESLSMGGQQGGLHDPTAMLYVPVSDLEPWPGQKGRACKDSKSTLGVLKASCNVRIKADAPVEPLIIRASAGECITLQLHNRLPEKAPDLAGFNTLLQIVNRDRLHPKGLTTFNNNLIRPSSHVGLHPQLVEYDVTHHDGTNVGLNRVQTVAPITIDPDTGKKKSAKPVTYVWYAGHHVATPTGDGSTVNLAAYPVEFGGFNISPADKIKQGQKALIGGGVIVPEGSTWPTALSELDRKRDHQTTDVNATRPTRTIATVTRADGTTLRDMLVVIQKGTNQRFADGSAIPNLASEGIGIPEDSHDAGQMAINYGTEPLWFRYGLPADGPFEKEGYGGVSNSHQAFSNVCCDNGGTATTADSNIGDPVTPVFTAKPGQDIYLRVLQPTGSGRGTTFNLHGHIWQRDPYIEGEVPSQTIGYNWQGLIIGGGQESITPAAHFDVVPLHGAGGAGAIPGDYLFKDQASFGQTSGLWGILRVEPETEERPKGGKK